MRVTYQQLLDKLLKATPEQLAGNVTVWDVRDNEHHPANFIEVVEEGDNEVLDTNHIVLTFGQDKL